MLLVYPELHAYLVQICAADVYTMHAGLPWSILAHLCRWRSTRPPVARCSRSSSTSRTTSAPSASRCSATGTLALAAWLHMLDTIAVQDHGLEALPGAVRPRDGVLLAQDDAPRAAAGAPRMRLRRGGHRCCSGVVRRAHACAASSAIAVSECCRVLPIA